MLLEWAWRYSIIGPRDACSHFTRRKHGENGSFSARALWFVRLSDDFSIVKRRNLIIRTYYLNVLFVNNALWRIAGIICTCNCSLNYVTKYIIPMVQVRSNYYISVYTKYTLIHDARNLTCAKIYCNYAQHT